MLAAQRRERARIRSERQQRWGRPKPSRITKPVALVAARRAARRCAGPPTTDKSGGGAGDRAQGRDWQSGFRLALTEVYGLVDFEVKIVRFNLAKHNIIAMLMRWLDAGRVDAVW